MSSKYLILESVLQCSYPVNNRDYIVNVIYELTQMLKSMKFYKVNHRNETVLVVRSMIGTVFKQRSYDIPVLIYITTQMPYEPPEVYLEKSQDVGVNPQNPDIDQKTNKIQTPSLRNWTTYTMLKTVIGEISNSFNKTFPIFKKSRQVGNSSQSGQSPYQPGESYYNQSQAYNLKMNQQTSRISQPGGYDYAGSYNYAQNPQPHLTNTYNPIYNNYQQQTYNNQFSHESSNAYNQVGSQYQPNISHDSLKRGQTSHMANVYPPRRAQPLDPKKAEAEMKSILIKEIRDKVDVKIKEEEKKFKQKEEKLNNFKNELNQQIKKYEIFTNKKSEINTTLSDLLNKSVEEVLNVQSHIADLQDRVLTQENCMKFVHVSNQQAIKLISIEATIDDFIAVCKKAFEKGILSFNESVKFIRTLSRETLKVKFVREKLLNRN